MKKSALYPLALSLTFLLSIGEAATITVNTADNTDFGAGKTNLVSAINLLASGDTIRFNIPGAGPHYLVSPTGGYPAITNKHNVTIDGYTQPGASPNTNPILSSNNASIKVVLTATNGELTVLDIPGYGTGESAVLFVYGSSNFTVKGICFLGPGGPELTPSPYAVSFAYNGPTDAAHGGHVSGCRIGLDLNGTTIARFKDAVTAFGPGPINGTVVGVKAGPADSAAARAQFNIIMAMHIPVILEGNNYRISGNFFNVYPDGLHDFIVDGGVSGPEHTLEAFMEFGGNQHHSLLIGTDGDGLNDAEERNVFGGVTLASDNRLLEWYSGGAPRTNIVIAGNYFGVGVDGVTRFTNSMKVFNGFNATATVQFGSDFNGVSDALEGNVISMNYPFDVIFSDPGSGLPVLPIFGDLSAGTRLSLRGNTLIGNNNPPYSWADGTGGRLAGFTNYSLPYMDPLTNSIIPTLDPASTHGHLKGTFAYGINDYTNIVIDVYQLDAEGWANGKTIAGTRNWIEMTDSASFTNGFAQGSKYLGSRVVPNNGSFDIDIAGMELGGGQVTVTVNYSRDPAGTTRGRIHTSNFSAPVNLAFIPRSAESVGVTRIVPDTVVWSHSQNFAGGGVTKINGYAAGEQAVEGSSVEATAGVLGDSTFLLAAITRATNDDANMSFTSVLIPATGGTPKLDNLFYTDAGTKWLKQINLSRQTGNPGRIGGDPRYGAVNYGGAGEVSLFAYPEFNSDGRWSNPFFDDALARSCRSYGVQLHQLNPFTLASTPTSKAVDSMFGRLWTNSVATIGGQDFGRTGSAPVGLDNGNFVFVGEDRTGFNNSGGNRRAAVVTIFAPNGAIVKEAFMATPDGVPDGSMWNSVGAYRGGFFVRPAGGVIYFFDNAGNLQGTNVHNATSGLIYDLGRSDGTRMCSDIRSRYVFQAGKAPESAAFTNIMLTAYDANTRQWIANTIVSDEGNQEVTSLGSTRLLDRCNVACDAYNRVTVAYRLRPDRLAFGQDQIVARVFSFDGTKFTPLTPTFFPFVQHDSDPANLAGFKSIEPSVAMTPREILFYAKGIWNGTANPTNPVVTLDNTHCYTILRHPAPIAPPRPIVTITKSGNNLNLSWNPDDGLFTVQTRSSVSSGAWANATAGNVPPPVSIPAGAGPLYVRLAR